MQDNEDRSYTGCYLHYRDVYSSKKTNGVDKKVKAQIKALNNAGLKCNLVYCPQPETTIGKVLSCLPFFSDGIEWPDPKAMSDKSFLYIRRPRFASKELLRFLSEVKRINPSIKVLYETPSYPYDEEMMSPLLYAALLKDKSSRKHLSKFVDRIATLTNDKRIFGINTIKIKNGIDLTSVQPKQPAPSLGTINILIVAQFEPWHGLDRLVAGLIAYYKNEPTKKVLLHVAGSGLVLNGLQRKVVSAGLEDRVVFYGLCDTDELDTLYDKCTVAVDCFGLHRKNAAFSASLKSREYLAKGIPIIASNEIDVFTDTQVDFFFKMPSGEDPVDIKSIVAFHDHLYDNEAQDSIITRIRTFAESHIEMGQAMREVIDYICETENP